MKAYLSNLMVQRFSISLILLYMSAMWAYGQTPVAQKIVREELALGDPAPALTIHSWLKGSPVTAFKRGKVYIIDFNNTSCSGCVNTIFHLHKIANKFRGEVEVVSIYNHEYRRPFESHYNNVKKRIEIFGEQLNFTLAIDVPERTTEAAWNGVKTSYAIVDKEGKIAFIGSSHNGQVMDEILMALLDGKHNFQAALTNQQTLEKKCLDFEFALYGLSRSINKSASWKDSVLAVLKEINQMIAQHPKHITLYRLKMNALTHAEDAAQINELLKNLLVVDRKLEYFDWHSFMVELRFLRLYAPALFNQLDRQLLLTIHDRAIHNDPLVSSIPGYVEGLLSVHLLSGNYEEATALINATEAKAKKDPGFPGLRNVWMHKFITTYLTKKKQSGMIEANQWLKAEAVQQMSHLKAINGLVFNMFGQSELTMGFLDVMLTIPINNELKAELLEKKAQIYAKMDDFRNALKYIIMAQNLDNNSTDSGQDFRYAYQIERYKKQLNASHGSTQDK